MPTTWGLSISAVTKDSAAAPTASRMTFHSESLPDDSVTFRGIGIWRALGSVIVPMSAELDPRNVSLQEMSTSSCGLPLVLSVPRLGLIA